MPACTKPQQRKKEESGRLIGERERDQIKFIDLRSERWLGKMLLGGNSMRK